VLAGIFYAVHPRRLYWVHLSWLCLAIMFCLTSFWIFWSYREVEWTLPRLMLILAAPGLIYVFSSILVPANAPQVESWRVYFFSVRLPLFACGAAMVLFIIFVNPYFIGISLMDSGQIQLYVLLGVFIVGAVSERPWLHSVLALAPPLAIAGILLSGVAQPGWNAP
jgi:hypothetical protein